MTHPGSRVRDHRCTMRVRSGDGVPGGDQSGDWRSNTPLAGGRRPGVDSDGHGIVRRAGSAAIRGRCGWSPARREKWQGWTSGAWVTSRTRMVYAAVWSGALMVELAYSRPTSSPTSANNAPSTTRPPRAESRRSRPVRGRDVLVSPPGALPSFSLRAEIGRVGPMSNTTTGEGKAGLLSLSTLRGRCAFEATADSRMTAPEPGAEHDRGG